MLQLALYLPSKKTLTFKTSRLIQFGEAKALAQQATGGARINLMPSSGDPELVGCSFLCLKAQSVRRAFTGWELCL